MADESYSQYGEDTIIDRLTGHKQSGFWVDIGAHDPDHLSITKMFYNRGWSGINLEPNPKNFGKFLHDRRKDINLQIGISNEPGKMPLILAPGAGSTMVEEYGKKWGDDAPRILVNVYPLSTVLDRYLPDSQKITFLKIDVEGYEPVVIRSNDWERYRPELVCVETTKPYTRISTRDVIDPIMKAVGYGPKEDDGVNTYYMDEGNK